MVELIIVLKQTIIFIYQVNHNFPDKIIVFRDGVGDGQLNVVGGHEVEQLKQCFDQFGDHYEPAMTVVVVQKRINARIFMKVTKSC